MSDTRYLQIGFRVAAERAEEMIADLVELGAPGVEERDQSTFDKAPDARTQLVVWLPIDDAPEFLRRAAEHGLPPPDADERVRDESEWRDAWKRYFAPRRVGRFVIVPSWERYTPAAGEVVIDMDPGRAFGTGGHASTRLCLEALSRLELPDDAPLAFLDVGTGSGVLAIACAKAWPAGRGIGVDIDADSVEVARENADRNGVADRVSLSETPVETLHGPFDVVFANILPEVLVPLAPALAALVSDGGRLFLSGILVERAAEVVAAYAACGLAVVDTLDEEGWRALVCARAR